MANFALLAFSDGAYGWSESYFDNNDENDQQVTKNNAVKLVASRSQFLGGPIKTGGDAPQVRYIRVGTIGVPRKTLLCDPYGNEEQLQNLKNLNPTNPAADNPYSALGCSFTTTAGHKSNRLFSGMSDKEILNQAIGAGALMPKFRNFCRNMVAEGIWGSLTYNRLTPNQSMVKTITQGADGRITMELMAAVAPTAGKCSQKVVIRDFKAAPGAPNINGIQNATPDATGLNWTLNRVYKPVGVPLCKGMLLLWEPAVDKFQQFIITGPSLKKRGGRLDQPRGRSRKKR